MNNYINSIDTDAAIGSILSNFETPWIMHSVYQSLNMKFRPFSEPMPNFADIVNRQLDNVLGQAPDFRDKVEETKVETNKEIIEAICQYYNLSFLVPFEEIHPNELYGITHTLYDVFVSRFTDYMVDFYISYIINNVDSIYAYLLSDPNIKKPKEKELQGRNFLDPKFYVIHNNLNRIIINMISYDITLEDLIGFFLPGPVGVRILQLISDNGDIYKNHYAAYLQDQRYMADLLTVIKLKMQVKTQEVFGVNVKEEEIANGEFEGEVQSNSIEGKS